MKICSLYGVGYYYIPGTDTCIKIGGYVRQEVYHNAAGGGYPNLWNAGGGAAVPGTFTRHYNSFAMMARFRLTADVRTQTEYGTLRSYFSFGLNWLNLANETITGAANLTTSLERAFIQFAGFTFGRSDTFFAFYNGAAYGFVPQQLDGSSGPAGINVVAYTWQFGNGLSATVSLEDAGAHSAPVLDLSNTSLFGAADNQGQEVPDIVANLRVDQAWGSAQIMGGLHHVGARYHTGNPGFVCQQGNTTGCSHPGEEWGWAVGAGLTLKMPWDAKDTLSGVIAYGEGASRFVAFGNNSQFIHKQGVALGSFSDAVYANPGVAGLNGELELTEAWGGTIAFEHYWTPSLRTSWVFGYLDVSYNSNAKALIAAGGCAASGMGNVTNCDPDWSQWRIASRTMWNPVQNLDIGLEVAYTKLETAFAGSGVVAAGQGLAVGPYNIQDEGFWTATFRVQRSFWP